MLWGIPWIVVAMMMADAPRYDYDDEKENKDEPIPIKLTKENALEFFNTIQQQNE